MKTLIYMSLIAAALSFTTANAQETLTCTGGSCLIGGYEVTDSNNDLVEIAFCTSGDCDANGWDIFRLNGLNSNVFCADSSCYGLGFQEISADSAANLIRARTCKDDGAGGSADCIANGWEDEFFGADARLENIVCATGGCDNGFIIETIVDNTANLEAAVADQEALIDQKRAEFKAYLQVNKQPNKELNKEIIDLRKELIDLKKQLRSNSGEQVVDTQQATCLSAGACFTAGYTLN